MALFLLLGDQGIASSQVLLDEGVFHLGNAVL
jgi:hypothetical protein